MSGLELFTRLINQEEEALKELMELYGDYLLRTAVLLLKDQQMAEEAVQDTFITSYEKLHQLTDTNKLKSWLTSILINRCRLQMRKQSWKQRFLRLDRIQLFERDEMFNEPEEHLFQLVQNQHLATAIGQLDYKYREVIILFYFNEMKISEIAQYAKQKENTIKSRLARGRALLKEILVKGEDGSE